MNPIKNELIEASNQVRYSSNNSDQPLTDNFVYCLKIQLNIWITWKLRIIHILTIPNN